MSKAPRVLLDAGVDVNVRSQPDTPEVRTQPGAEAGYRGGGARGGRDSGPSYEATVSAGSTPLLVATVRAQVPLALFLLEKGADPNAGDAGFTPLHWAAGTWESGEANPVFGFSDAMSGIPDRQEKLQLVKSLLAHGANVERPDDPAAACLRWQATTTSSARRRSCSPLRQPISKSCGSCSRLAPIRR